MTFRFDPRLAFVALAVATLLWALVQKQEKFPATVSVPLIYEEAEGIVKRAGFPTNVTLSVRASRQRLRTLEPSGFAIRVRNQVGRTGHEIVVLDPRDVDAPLGIVVQAVSPAHFSVEYDREMTRNVPVRVPLQGTPPEGYEVAVDSIVTEPRSVTVEGPAKLVAALEWIETAPVDVSDATSRIVRDALPAISPSTELQLDAEIRTTIPVRPRTEQRTFTAVAISVLTDTWRASAPNPRSLDVTVEGPAPVVRGLQAQAIQLNVDVAGKQPRRDDYYLEVFASIDPSACAGCRVVGLQPQTKVHVNVRSQRLEPESPASSSAGGLQPSLPAEGGLGPPSRDG